MINLITFSKCKCGKEILVEQLVNGTNHTMNITVVCKECVILSDGYKADHPENAKEIESWLKNKEKEYKNGNQF